MLLKLDPKERIKGQEALYHPYFDQLRGKSMNHEMTKSIVDVSFVNPQSDNKIDTISNIKSNNKTLNGRDLSSNDNRDNKQSF